MIEISVNGENLSLEKGTSLAGLLERFAAQKGTVVAVNETFVPRSEHGHHRLSPGDRVELLAPMEGG